MTSPRTRTPEGHPACPSGDARGPVERAAEVLSSERLCGVRECGACREAIRLALDASGLLPVLVAAEAALALVVWDPTRPHEPMGSAGVCRIDGYAWPCPIERLRAAVEQARGGTS